MLLGWICCSFGLQEPFLAAGNEMVVVELGGVEGMEVNGLRVFEELKKMKMELAMKL